jgi:hypothetical protein
MIGPRLHSFLAPVDLWMADFAGTAGSESVFFDLLVGVDAERKQPYF